MITVSTGVIKSYPGHYAMDSVTGRELVPRRLERFIIIRLDSTSESNERVGNYPPRKEDKRI